MVTICDLLSFVCNLITFKPIKMLFKRKVAHLVGSRYPLAWSNSLTIVGLDHLLGYNIVLVAAT